MTINDRVEWVAYHILPHEAALRRWLRRFVGEQEIEDIVQEAYCNIAELEVLVHIIDPKRYLYQVARNIVMGNLRRARVVTIESIGGLQEIETLLVYTDASQSPERIAADRALLTRIGDVLTTMPERTRTIIRLRRLDGLSQREVALRMGVSEAVVENDLSRGLKQIVAQLSAPDQAELSNLTKGSAHARRR